MKFSIQQSIAVLERSPVVLHDLLIDLSDEWTRGNEGADTWSPFDVLGHLIHCDEDNWIPRIKVVLSDSVVRKFEPLDRFAQAEKSMGKSMQQLLDEFKNVRFDSIQELRRLTISDEQLLKTAIHPDLGTVTLSQLISTWVVHDLDHLSQIARVMAKQYTDQVGPWHSYMRVLK